MGWMKHLRMKIRSGRW